LDTTLV